MVFHAFPDLQWLKQQVERNFASKRLWSGRKAESTGWPTVVLNVKTDHIYRDDIRGPLSIFTNLSGESAVFADKRRVRINDDYFFVTNHDQRYTLEVEKQKTAETFNIHFGDRLVSEAFSSLTAAPESLIEGGDAIVKDEPLNFHNKLIRKSARFNDLVKKIARSGNDVLLLEQHLFDLITLLLNDHLTSKQILKSIPALKRTTKDELLKRLFVSTDFIHAYYDRDLSLDELSQTACLSKFHFLRLFKTAFEKTPHQYLNEVRCERAKHLLLETKLDVAAIARNVGFKDASSFSRMFFNSNGLYPSQLRQ